MSVVSSISHGTAADGAAPPTAAAPATPAAVDRQRIQAYYDQKLDKEYDKLAALRLSSERRKLVLAIGGGVLLLVCAAAWIATKLEYLPARSLEAYELGGAAIALVLIVIALALKPTEAMPPPEHIEREISAAREHDIEAALADAQKLLAPAGAAMHFDHRLISYPDKQWCTDNTLAIHARLGFNREPRFSPVTVTAFKALPGRIAFYQGYIDLTTGVPLSERLMEVRREDISSIERSSKSAPAPKQPEIRGFQRMMRSVGKPRFPRDKDAITIHLSGMQPVTIVLRDADFSPALSGARLPLSEPHETVEAFWAGLRNSWVRDADKA